MYKKQLDTLGELKVATALHQKGYFVYQEIGDLSKVDLIALDKDYNPIKIQVKSLACVNGTVAIKSTKSGPNYSFRYLAKHANVYAVYVYNKDVILYINSRELLSYSTLTIRIELPRNNQSNKIYWWQDYSDFERALRGHTPDTLTDNAEGDEMVQTSKLC